MTAGTRLTDFSEEAAEWDGEFEIVQCRRALSPTNIFGLKYVLNPYGGCSHGCLYCFAPSYTHSDPATWRVVRVRSNIVDRLSRELPGTEGPVGVGSATDAYQYAESRFLLTRRCLEVLRDHGRETHILTKSDLVTRDIPLLRDMDCTVGITITGLDERISKMVEPGAPLPPARLDALRRPTDEGIRTFAMVSPVMSPIRGHEAELADAIADTGTACFMTSSLSVSQGDGPRMARMGISQSDSAEVELADQLAARGLKRIRGVERSC